MNMLVMQNYSILAPASYFIPDALYMKANIATGSAPAGSHNAQQGPPWNDATLPAQADAALSGQRAPPATCCTDVQKTLKKRRYTVCCIFINPMNTCA